MKEENLLCSHYVIAAQKTSDDLEKRMLMMKIDTA